jgi:hypothetical protein
MENPNRLNEIRRRRRIAGLALVPVAAALVLGALESGRWLVIYNDSQETLGEITLEAGPEHWTVRELAPRESRRLRLRGAEASELIVAVDAWAPEPPFRTHLDGRHTAITTLRLGANRAVTTTGESGLWARWLNW